MDLYIKIKHPECREEHWEEGEVEKLEGGKGNYSNASLLGTSVF